MKPNRRDTREAEKDLVFALTRLQEGKRVSAYLNAAVALVRIGGALTQQEHEEALAATEALVARSFPTQTLPEIPELLI